MAGLFSPERFPINSTDNGDNAKLVPNSLGDLSINWTDNENLVSNLQLPSLNLPGSFDEIIDLVNITPPYVSPISKVEKHTCTADAQGDEDEDQLNPHSDEEEMSPLIPTTVEEHNPDIRNKDLATDKSPQASQNVTDNVHIVSPQASQYVTDNVGIVSPQASQNVTDNVDDIVWYNKKPDSGYGSSIPLTTNLATDKSPQASQNVTDIVHIVSPQASQNVTDNVGIVSPQASQNVTDNVGIVSPQASQNVTDNVGIVSPQASQNVTDNVGIVSPQASQNVTDNVDDIVWYNKKPDSGYGSSIPLTTSSEEFVLAEEANTNNRLGATFAARLPRNKELLQIWPMIIKMAKEMAGPRTYIITNKGKPVKDMGTGVWNTTIKELGFTLNVRYLD